MTQVDLGPAGIRANIEHAHAQVIEAENRLQLAQNELAFWLMIAREQLLPATRQ
jgi:outer membrane protein TolC